MNTEKIYIRNMLSKLCISVVRSELEKLDIEPVSVELGEVFLKKKLSGKKKEELGRALQPFGFSLIDNRKERMVEQVKNLIRELVHCNYGNLEANLSEYIGDKTNCDYNYISKIFSEEESITIKRYFIVQKIEKVKEFIVCGDLTLSEIACKLNYSSVADLSAQFKKVTGISPSGFKKDRTNHKRIPLDDL